MTEDELRLEQVGLLTSGLELPLAPVPFHVLRAIARELRAAWEHLADVAPGQLSRMEKHVNASLEGVLKMRLREGTSLAREAVVDVERGVEVLSFDGQSTECRPDLNLKLAEHPLPLVVECKWIDPPDKTVAMYCDNGLARFLRGDYAWHQREALLLAYVNDGSTLSTCLDPHVNGARSLVPDPYETVKPIQLVPTLRGVARSTHGRNFQYRHAAAIGRVPGPIDVWHVWVMTLPT